jgi:hypothetical protein
MPNTDNEYTWEFSVRSMANPLEVPILEMTGTTAEFALTVANTLIPGDYLVTVVSDETYISYVMDVFGTIVVISDESGDVVAIYLFTTVPANTLN